MNKYVKPTFEFVELRIEERLARCYTEGQNHEHIHLEQYDHSNDIPGTHPGCLYHCPHS